MLHTIELSEASERVLRRIADEGGKNAEVVLRLIAENVLAQSADGEMGPASTRIAVERGSASVQSTPGVMGGDSCIRDTRIPAWLLVRYKQAGYPDDAILANYPSLGPADLVAAWDFYAANTARVEAERRAHDAAA